MEERTFTFQLSSHDVDGLLPQVSRALEERTELLSRRRYPFLWKLIDKCNAVTKGRTRSRLRTRVMSVICLALGIFLFVPGLMEPQELRVPLLAGAAAIGAGIGGLWRSRKGRKNPFDRVSRLILDRQQTVVAERPQTVHFSEDGMMLSAEEDDDVECVLYRQFECILETADLLFLVYDEAVTVLQKTDLTVGDMEGLRALLTEHADTFKFIE